MSTQSPETQETQLTDYLDDHETRQSVDWHALEAATTPLAESSTTYEREQAESRPSRPASINADESSQDSPRRCQGCGGHVTRQYARTMGDRQNRVHECQNCENSTNRRRFAGAAAGLDVQTRQYDGVTMQ